MLSSDFLILGLPPAAAAVCGVLVVLHFNRKKKRRRDLRLAAGQSKLLGDYIFERMALLDQYEVGLREEADRSLDKLQTALIDRQAHLLNYEDLAILQRYKLEIQESSARDLAIHPSPRETSQPKAPPPPPSTRNELEDQLLEKINQLNAPSRKPGRPRA